VAELDKMNQKLNFSSLPWRTLSITADLVVPSNPVSVCKAIKLHEEFRNDVVSNFFSFLSKIDSCKHWRESF
jgi:hypothetical protein